MAESVFVGYGELDPTSGGGHNSTRTSDGRIHVVYHSALSLRYQYSDDNGLTWSTPLTLATNTQYPPLCQIICDEEDNLYVVANNTPENNDIGFFKYNASTQSWETIKWLSYPGQYFSPPVSIAIAPDGVIYVVAMCAHVAMQQGCAVIYSDDRGETWNAAGIISLTHFTSAAIAVGTNGTIHIPYVNRVADPWYTYELGYLSGTPFSWGIEIVDAAIAPIRTYYYNPRVILDINGDCHIQYLRNYRDNPGGVQYRHAKKVVTSWVKTDIYEGTIQGISYYTASGFSHTREGLILASIQKGFPDGGLYIFTSDDGGDTWVETQEIENPGGVYPGYRSDLLWQNYPSNCEPLSGFGCLMETNAGIYWNTGWTWPGLMGLKYTFTPETRKNNFLSKNLSVKTFENSIEV